MSEPVMAISAAKNNAELMVECRRLGYLRDEWIILDPTYGLGRFWNQWRPSLLVASDLDPAKSPVGYSVDFTALPWGPATFDAVTLDGPYKLNGTGGSHASDEAYGVATSGVSWQERHDLICKGITDCARVLRPASRVKVGKKYRWVGGMLLIKCQDQVCSAAVRWQTRVFADHAETQGCELVDMLHLQSYRAQPENTTQEHARRNYSTLLITQKVRP